MNAAQVIDALLEGVRGDSMRREVLVRACALRSKVVPAALLDQALQGLHADPRLPRPFVQMTWAEPMCLVMFREVPLSPEAIPLDRAAPLAETSPSGLQAPLPEGPPPSLSGESRCDTSSSPAAGAGFASPVAPVAPAGAHCGSSQSVPCAESSAARDESQVETLDRLLEGLGPGGLLVIAARTPYGKSRLAALIQEAVWASKVKAANTGGAEG